jgi:hypothetical protein
MARFLFRSVDVLSEEIAGCLQRLLWTVADHPDQFSTLLPMLILVSPRYRTRLGYKPMKVYLYQLYETYFLGDRIVSHPRLKSYRIEGFSGVS